jgi:hypothetical protein
MPKNPGHIGRMGLGDEPHQVLGGSPAIEPPNHVKDHLAFISYQFPLALIFHIHYRRSAAEVNSCLVF